MCIKNSNSDSYLYAVTIAIKIKRLIKINQMLSSMGIEQRKLNMIIF